MKLQKETKHGRWYADACGAAFAMELIGERWTLLIVRELMLGARRFSEIRAELPGLSAKVLTERLERLEDLGVLTRRRLPPPAAVQVYELTSWGYELEPVMQELGRWAVRSPLHDPELPLTPVAFMLSLRTMMSADAAGDLELSALFETSEARYLAELRGGELAARPIGDEAVVPDLTFRADAAPAFAGLFYGNRPASECGVTIDGEPALARRFISLFDLPSKCPLPPIAD